MTALGEHGTTQGGGPALKQITKIFLIICILGSYSEEVWSKTHDYSLVPSVGAKSSKGYFGLEAAVMGYSALMEIPLQGITQKTVCQTMALFHFLKTVTEISGLVIIKVG